MEKEKGGFWKKVLIVILVILIIGALIDAYLRWKEKNLTDEEKLERLKKDHNRYLKGNNKAFINEKWIYFTSRTIIAIGLLSWNIRFYYVTTNQDLSKVLNMDEVIILVYSFLAFAIAGTPSRFVKSLRRWILNIQKGWHVGKLDITLINKEIEELEFKITQKHVVFHQSNA